MEKYLLIQIIITGIFLSICTYIDLKRKYVNIYICLIFGAIGVMCRCIFENSNLLSVLATIIPGIFMMLISIISNESIGKGDSIVICTIGLYMGLINVIIILFIGLMVSCITGIICMVIMKKGKNYRLPFVPFITLGFIYQILMGV